MLKQMLSSMENQMNGCIEEEGSMRNVEKLKREEGTCLWGCIRMYMYIYMQIHIHIVYVCVP